MEIWGTECPNAFLGAQQDTQGKPCHSDAEDAFLPEEEKSPSQIATCGDGLDFGGLACFFTDTGLADYMGMDQNPSKP